MNIPEPTSITQRGRYAEALWDLGEIADGTHAVVNLSVHHFGRPGYHYVALLTREKHEQGNGFESRSYWLFSSARICTRPGKRFSVTDLRQTMEDAITLVEEFAAEGRENIVAMFAPVGKEEAA